LEGRGCTKKSRLSTGNWQKQTRRKAGAHHRAEGPSERNGTAYSWE